MSQKRGDKAGQGSRKKKNISVTKEIVENMDENSLVLQQFRSYAVELLDKQERFERIVKLNRDITVESKRIIFLLHTIDKERKQEFVLKEAKQRLTKVKEVLFKAIAQELEDQDAYHYLRAYRGGLEEYVEALTLHQYLEGGKIKDCNFLQGELTYQLEDECVANTDSESSSKSIRALVTPYEYILGIGDLTGELMRKCINNLATGDIDSCYQTCSFVRNMYKGFVACTALCNKEINRKFYTLKQNLCKIENVCYTIKVRGSEIPKHILVDVVTADHDNDEGYQAF